VTSVDKYQKRVPLQMRVFILIQSRIKRDRLNIAIANDSKPASIAAKTTKINQKI
jgi:hypothetical protein